MLATLLANAFSKRKRQMRDFLPPWYEMPSSGGLSSFEQILEMADPDR